MSDEAKPKFIVDDYAAIAQGMRELELEKHQEQSENTELLVAHGLPSFEQLLINCGVKHSSVLWENCLARKGRITHKYKLCVPCSSIQYSYRTQCTICHSVMFIAEGDFDRNA